MRLHLIWRGSRLFRYLNIQPARYRVEAVPSSSWVAARWRWLCYVRMADDGTPLYRAITWASSFRLLVSNARRFLPPFRWKH